MNVSVNETGFSRWMYTIWHYKIVSGRSAILTPKAACRLDIVTAGDLARKDIHRGNSHHCEQSQASYQIKVRVEFFSHRTTRHLHVHLEVVLLLLPFMSLHLSQTLKPCPVDPGWRSGGGLGLVVPFHTQVGKRCPLWICVLVWLNWKKSCSRAWETSLSSQLWGWRSQGPEGG